MASEIGLKEGIIITNKRQINHIGEILSVFEPDLVLITENFKA
ncbi:MAG: hypothetical protein ACJA2S_001156 [Cyclobacteriaceae bacterium]